MIPWFFAQSEIQRFRDLPNKKKDKIRKDLMVRIQTQKSHLDSQIELVKFEAQDAKRYHAEGQFDQRKESLKRYQAQLRGLQPLLNQTVKDNLYQGIYELMSFDGFEFPDLLVRLRKDIDFGLFSVNLPDDLDKILDSDTDPYEELGIDLSDYE